MTLSDELWRGFGHMDMSRGGRIALVAALEREVKAAVRNWQVSEREHEGRSYKFFENERAVLVCGGIGAEAARRATEAVIQLYQPAIVISVGFAGALGSKLKVGDGFTPRYVLDANDGSRRDTGQGEGTLVSFGQIAGTEQKAKLARAYGAEAVDMEAAAVARGAEAHGLGFVAYKTVSDEHDFAMPDLGKFVKDGRFQSGRFILNALGHPWWWGKLIQLGKNSSQAAKTLALWLEQYDHPEIVDRKAGELHPMKRA